MGFVTVVRKDHKQGVLIPIHGLCLIKVNPKTAIGVMGGIQITVFYLCIILKGFKGHIIGWVGAQRKKNGKKRLLLFTEVLQLSVHHIFIMDPQLTSWQIWIHIRLFYYFIKPMIVKISLYVAVNQLTAKIKGGMVTTNFKTGVGA